MHPDLPKARPDRLATGVRTQARAKALHDRAIFLDGKVWLVSQSLNGIAKRSPATIQEAAPEIAAAKLAAYESVWNGAQPVNLT